MMRKFYALIIVIFAKLKIKLDPYVQEIQRCVFLAKTS